MDNKTFFISDAHLSLRKDESEVKKRELLLDFLNEVKRLKANLFIVGDLFDFWFEYRHYIPKHFFRIIRALQEMIDEGCKVYILSGNHDYWLGSFIESELGATVYKNPVDTVINDKKFHINHGDGLLKNDYGYRILKKILRNRFIIWAFRLIHPDIGFEIAKKVSSTSRNAVHQDSEKLEKIRREIMEFGKSKFEQGFDYVVTGHYHYPTEYCQSDKVFLNLGDWMRYFSFGYFDGDSLSLCYWTKEHEKGSGTNNV